MPAKPKNWVLIGVAGVGAAAFLGLMALIAVIASARYVIFYASHGPIPGQKVLRPVQDFDRPELQKGAQPPDSPAEAGAAPLESQGR